MRMDRYEEDTDIKETRTNKNQELYTDIYLNNAYVDINELKEVMEKTDSKEEVKLVKPEVASYSYVEKNYDINSLIEEAIKNKKDDKLKRSLDFEDDVNNIIKTINENQLDNQNNNTLLTDLMPDNDTTTIMEPLNDPIDTSIVDTSVIHKDEMTNEVLNEMMEESLEQKKDIEVDDSFKNEVKSSKKIVFIIIGIVLLIAIILGLLIWKKIIKI